MPGRLRRVVAAVAAATILAWAVAAAPARAQDTATLVADQVYISGDTRLIAEGSVEVFFGEARLLARRIVYDKATDRLTIEGPITLTAAGGTLIVADMAELSPDLTEGILHSARVVLNDQLQMAANQVARIDGRYTQLTKVVASSCQVCPSNPVPLWEIRARQIVHDQQERQLYFDHAQFRVMGLPVFYLPRLRMPDPTVERATGFLVPSLRTSTALGTGLRLPYFIALGDSRDVTVTPYVSTGGMQTLGLRYRQAFANGGLTFEGAVSRDRILPSDTRGYVFAEGSFLLPRDFRLNFGIEAVSDPAYLLDYGISDQDRLESGVELTRTRRNAYVSARVLNFHSIRAGDSNSTLPTLMSDVTIHRRFRPEILGGVGGFLFQTHSHRRNSDTDFDANGDGVTDGRDLARITARFDWRRTWITTGGIAVSGQLALSADQYYIGQDAGYPSTITRVTPVGALELRWPWVRTAGKGGASHVIEPVVQLVWAPDRLVRVPNEDSLLVELDEGNLFALNRFPGADQIERGFRANIGVSWTRHDADGWSFGVTGGRVLRARDLGQFSSGSGLDGTLSDWILAAQVAHRDGLTVTNRALFDDDLSFTKNELSLSWTNDRVSMDTGYIWMVADPAGGRPASTSELAFDAGWQISDGWRGTATGRYDFSASRATRAGLGFEYRNECVTVDLSLSRRFTSSTSVRPTTDLDLSVVLNGFGTGKDGRRYRRSCGM